VQGGLVQSGLAIVLRQTVDTTEPIEPEVIAEVGEALTSNDAEQWLFALAILVVAVIISRVARIAVKRVMDRASSNSFLGELLGRLLGYFIVAFGFVYALEEIGVRITPLLGALGIVGIAIAFALQSILENFVAGVLLQVRRPFAKGDEIESQGYTGVITSIDARTMTLRTPDGEIVRLPNADVIRNPIINLTEYGHRRTNLAVGIAYGSDVAQACEVALDVLKSAELVLEKPAPAVSSAGFGDSSIDLEVLFWHKPRIADKRKATHEVIVAISRAFEEHDITIPFPQRTLHFAPDAAQLTVRTSEAH